MTKSPLKQLVINLLAAKSSEAASIFNREFHHPERKHLDTVAQLRDLSTYWRMQLGAMPICTLTIRTSILDEVSPTTWLMLFERDVLGFIIDRWVPYKLKGIEQ